MGVSINTNKTLGVSAGSKIIAPQTSAFTNIYSTSYDGVDDYVDLGTSIPLGIMTISWWMKSTDTVGNKSVTGNGLGRLNIVGTTPLILLSPWNYRYFDDQAAKFDGNWHHWLMFIAGAGNSDIASSRIFVDGSEIGTGSTVPGSSPAYASPSLLGRGQYGYIAATIDEFAVWTDDKTSDVTAIYNGGNPQSLDSYNPVGYWRFEEGSGTTAIDSGSGGNDGTLVNGTTYSTDVP